MICIICFDLINMEDGSGLICGHVFHRECLYKWISIRSDCPYCRTYIYRKDIFSIEQHYLISENGCVLNGYHFYPRHISDMKICLLYLFLLQHAILFTEYEIPIDINKKLVDILWKIIDNNYNHIDTPWKLSFTSFYKQNDFHIEYGTINPKPINIIDIRSIYFPDREDRRYLDQRIWCHGWQGVFQERCECSTIC
jgi:hypothetical protein